MHLDRLRAEIEADIARELTFAPPRPKAVPLPPQASVKLNAAAILREDALYRCAELQCWERGPAQGSDGSDCGTFEGLSRGLE